MSHVFFTKQLHYSVIYFYVIRAHTFNVIILGCKDSGLSSNDQTFCDFLSHTDLTDHTDFVLFMSHRTEGAARAESSSLHLRFWQIKTLFHQDWFGLFVRFVFGKKKRERWWGYRCCCCVAGVVRFKFQESLVPCDINLGAQIHFSSDFCNSWCHFSSDF